MKTVITAKIKDKESSWTETFTVNFRLTDIEAEDYVKTLIKNFNLALRPHETARSLIQIVNIERYFI